VTDRLVLAPPILFTVLARQHQERVPPRRQGLEAEQRIVVREIGVHECAQVGLRRVRLQRRAQLAGVLGPRSASSSGSTASGRPIWSARLRRSWGHSRSRRARRCARCSRPLASSRTRWRRDWTSNNRRSLRRCWPSTTDSETWYTLMDDPGSKKSTVRSLQWCTHRIPNLGKMGWREWWQCQIWKTAS
jgi:hypothetical protein